MSFVLDSSVTLSWYFDDEATALTDALFDQVPDQGAVVPSLWRLEVANGFQMAVRRKRIDTAYRDASLKALETLPIEVDAETDTHAWRTTVQLADRFRLTVYDAVYLELAQRRAMPLATLDREVRAAARALGVALLGR